MKQINSVDDSKSEAFAQEVVESIFPSEPIRRQCMALLVNSILAADNDGHASGVWAVTVAKSGGFIRLNVGTLEVLAFFPGQVHFILDDPQTEEAAYKSVPTSKVKDVPVEKLAKELPALLPSHRNLIEKAALTVSKRTRYHRACSPGMLEYLRRYLQVKVPDPIYK